MKKLKNNFNKMFMKNPKLSTMSQLYTPFSAFTLAEVLITLAIIGVVAAITIPTLMNKISDAETTAKLKKEYSILSQAAMNAANENGGSLANACAADSDSICFGNLFKPYLKTVKYCPGDGTKDCWHKSGEFYFFDDTPIDQNWSGYITVILSDGTLISFTGLNANCVSAPDEIYKATSFCGYSYVDINGFKKPNTLGKDIFEFKYTPNSVIPSGSPQITKDATFGNACPSVGENNSEACTYYYMYAKK